jgi:predicted TIM-barrel fold metal-dependent hydrolase
MPKAIDAVVNLHTPEVLAIRPRWVDDFYANKIGVEEGLLAGLSLEGYIEKMDRAGVERSFLVASKEGPLGHPANFHTPVEMIAEAVQRFPDRFSGLAGIDPTEGMRGVRDLEFAIRELGFIGAHLYPHWFEMAPDHRKYYPFYAKCVELDIPIQMQIGHCLRYTAQRPLPSVGRPILLDTIACDFPELKLIGIHIGWPWTEEMISVAWKHPNVYIGCDAYGPRYWKPEFVHFINSWGQDKVLFGTDFPVIDPERSLREIAELGLRPQALDKLLRENALRVYGLDVAGRVAAPAGTRPS